ncbi:MAG: apolipoprotein N-acyltransferase [Acidobacteria bacterium RIFCSPLOWO2_12_FULL_59_11]|nr:MAG: apolipoprotein N-acyltransferase [Acidobacteria bacterium RIFCSPLOWO2_12_FULL_59_11]
MVARRFTEISSAFVPLALTASSGLLLVLAFPKFNLFPLSLVALAPLLVVAVREPSPFRRFLWGFLAGCVFFAGTCYWIYGVMHRYGGLGIAASAGVFILFVFVLALYWGFFSWLAGTLWRTSWGPIAVPFLWVALELARAHLFSGFPWLLLGYALTDYATLARMARWTGVYGLSYLLVSLNVAWAWLWLREKRKAAVSYLLIHLAFLAGLGLTASRESYPDDQKAFLVQTNIPQEVSWERWDLPTQSPLLARLEDLTLQAVGQQAQPALVIFPEMPAPFYFWDDTFTRPYAEGIAQKTNSYFLTGIIAFVPGSNHTQPLNSELLLDPTGRPVSQYDKMHLVPFGEYVPLKNWLWFADNLTAEVGDFVPGDRVVVSTLPSGRLSGLICYEAIFPNLVRQFARDGAEVLVNISNDGWYGSTSARDQHLLMARMRAIENARYLLRATNTGITAVIRPDGRIASQLPPDQPAVLEAKWAFQSRLTFYARYGDWFPILSSVLTLLALAAAWRSQRQKASAGSGFPQPEKLAGP